MGGIAVIGTRWAAVGLLLTVLAWFAPMFTTSQTLGAVMAETTAVILGVGLTAVGMIFEVVEAVITRHTRPIDWDATVEQVI